MSECSRGKLVESLKCLHLQGDCGLLGALELTNDDAAPQENGENQDKGEIAENKTDSVTSEAPKTTTCSLVSEVSKDMRKYRVVSNTCKVYVGNISYKVKTRELKEFFSLFGKVLHAQIIQERTKKRSRGFGFVTFSNKWEAERAMSSEDYERTMDGRILTVVPPLRKRKGHTNNHEMSLEDAVEEFTQITEPERENNSQDEILQPQSVTVNSLNDDIMLHIFSYLGLKDRINLERVCCRWRHLAVKSWISVYSLEFRGIFSILKGGLTDDILLSLFRRGCANLRSLDLSASPFLLTEFAIHCIAKHCKNLRELDLTGVEVSTSSLKTLSQKCTLIEKLKLQKCYKAGEKGFWWLFKQCTNLKHVDIADSKRITGQCFFMLPASIESLNLKECTRLNDVGFRYIGTRCSNLKSIDISECASITDTGLLELTQNCTKIEKLIFVRPPKEITLGGLTGIGNLNQLRELNISRCEAVGDDFLFVLGRSCIHLLTLNIEACGQNVTDAGLQSLVTCYQLKHLMISYLDKITHAGLSHLVGNGTLESIIARACPGLTNKAVEYVVRGCPALACLDISGCLNITEPCLECFTSYCASDETSLTVVVGGTSIREECVTNFQSRCPGCVFVTHDLSVELLRTDRDPYFGMGSFYPEYSDDEEEEDEEQEEVTVHHQSFDDQMYEDYLEADDPAMLNEFDDYQDWLSDS